MSAPPLYYIHTAAPSSEGWSNASRYRLTSSQMLLVLGYYGGDRSAEEIALSMLNDQSSQPLNDSLLWQREHIHEARHAHSKFYPSTTRIQPGLVVNGARPWLATSPDDLTWSANGLGLAFYKAPYSKMLYSAPLPAHELQICYTAAVCEWTRPLLDYVVWTPGGSAVKQYTPDIVLSSRHQLKLSQVWEAYLWPRLQHFQSTVLQPLLLKHDLDPIKIYDCNTNDYVAVRNPDMSFQALANAFAT